MKATRIILSTILLFAITRTAVGQEKDEIKIYHSLEEALEKPENVEYLEIKSVTDTDSLALLKEFPKLKSLSLIDFHSNTAPEVVAELENLEELRFVNDDFSTIPLSYSSLTNLKRLEFIYDTHLDLKNTLRILSQMPSLVILKIEGLPEPNFSDDLEFPNTLQFLSLRDNHLNSLPNSISNITSLKVLDIGDNEFPELPSNLTNLSNLNTIYLDRLPFIQVAQIFPVLNNMPKLQYVHLEGNHLNNDGIKKYKELSLYQIFLDDDLVHQSIMRRQKINLDLPKLSRHSSDPNDASFKIPLNKK